MYTFKDYKRPEILTNHLNLGGENPAGEKIEVTSLYLTRGGKPWIAVMGEFHFSRCDRKYWYDELCKMKAGGITLVSTYIFWIYHEEIEGVFDFNGDNDLRAFILECKRAGLEVVIRIGPWAHGECRNGGFPDWSPRNHTSRGRIMTDILKKYIFSIRKFLNRYRGFSIKMEEISLPSN